MKEEITKVFHQIIETLGESFQSSLESIIQFITLIDVIKSINFTSMIL
jgi:hypothetical protein